MMFIFSSDEELRIEQRRAAKLERGARLSPEAERAERIEHEREVREHRRWREFAFLLFVAPLIVSVTVAVVGWLIMHAGR